MDRHEQERIEKVMKLPDLPAAARKTILDYLCFTLTQMPTDAAEQRRLMLEQNKDAPTHTPNGNEIQSRSVVFTERVIPRIAGFSCEFRAQASTTHNITKDVSHPEGAASEIQLGIVLSGGILGGLDTRDNNRGDHSLRLEKLLRQIAAEADLIEKDHSICPEGHFGIMSYTTTGDEACKSLGFCPADYKRVQGALNKMVEKINIEVATEAKSEGWFL